VTKEGSDNDDDDNIIIIKVKVKLPLYTPGQALWVPGSSDSQNFLTIGIYR
jgi:hypothetical protein